MDLSIKHILDTYGSFSQKLGDRVRALSFAGIGIVWVFKVDTDSGTSIPSELLPPPPDYSC